MTPPIESGAELPLSRLEPHPHGRSAMRLFVSLTLSLLFGWPAGFAQSQSADCNAEAVARKCILAAVPQIDLSVSASRDPLLLELPQSSRTAAVGGPDYHVNSAVAFTAPKAVPKQGFHWGRALLESFTFLSIEQAYVVHDDYRWVTIENGVPFNHYWRDYKQSLSTWVHSGWNDGDPALYSYLGHPLQGAMTSYIQIQNDPKGEKLEFSNTKAYWHSRLRATLFNAIYSTQWNIGPLSEMTVEKYGAKVRSPWTHQNTWPCYKDCFTGVGQVDLVMTPVGGLGWLLGEDILDRFVVRRVEEATRNQFLIDTVRCSLNPIRSGANILHGKRPWYRASRDGNEVPSIGVR